MPKESGTATVTERPPSIVARLADKWLEHRLLLDPQLAIGGAYMSGRLSVERGGIYDLLALLASNVQQQPLPRWTAGFDAVRFTLRRILQFNPLQSGETQRGAPLRH
jgi:cyclopropane-fatty-acyl-phospholipid synthase